MPQAKLTYEEMFLGVIPFVLQKYIDKSNFSLFIHWNRSLREQSVSRSNNVKSLLKIAYDA